jgi:hypothetical protein
MAAAGLASEELPFGADTGPAGFAKEGPLSLPFRDIPDHKVTPSHPNGWLIPKALLADS